MFTSQISLGRWGAHCELSTLDTAHKFPTARKGPNPGQKGPIAPIGTINKYQSYIDHAQN